MKKVFIMLLGIAGLFLFSCGNQQQDPEATVIQDTTITNTDVAQLDIQLINNDSIIQATVQAGKIPDSLSLHIDHAYQQVHLIIQHIMTDSLNASLVAAGDMRNIRFNQIIMPDGTMDGPFSHEIHYGTPQQGDYTLILARDNMADGVVEGPLKVHIQLK